MGTKRTVRGVAPLAIVLAVPAVALAAVGVRASAEPDEGSPRPATAPTGTPPPPPPPSPTLSPARPPVAGDWEVVARYTFDRGLGTGVVPDDSGHGHTLQVASRNGGRIMPAVRGAGLAVSYPEPCRSLPVAGSDGSACPRAVLQADSSSELNPGTRPFSWGAMVQLSPTDTSPGENILQKGLRAPTGQFKLQVDGAAGYPSCVLTETVTESFHEAYGQTTIADGQWHRIDCVRTRDRLAIFIDGQVSDHRLIPSDLRVSNSMPLRIGGKSVLGGNDQFNGSVDNVYVAIG